jgi:plasmid stability protein
MRQLIARVDDDLHGRLKRRAREEGRSLNSLVTEILRAAVESDDPRARLRARLAAEGRLVVPPEPERVPTLDEAIAAGRGTSGFVSEWIEAERRAR